VRTETQWEETLSFRLTKGTFSTKVGNTNFANRKEKFLVKRIRLKSERLTSRNYQKGFRESASKNKGVARWNALKEETPGPGYITPYATERGKNKGREAVTPQL